MLTASMPMTAPLRLDHKGFVKNVKEKPDEKGGKRERRICLTTFFGFVYHKIKAFTHCREKLTGWSLFFLTCLMVSLLFTQYEYVFAFPQSSLKGEFMEWDDYDEGYSLDDEDEMALIEAGEDGEFLPDRLRDELDHDLYEQEKEETDSDDFPESFEEWKLMKEQELWEDEEDEEFDSDLLDYDE